MGFSEYSLRLDYAAFPRCGITPVPEGPSPTTCYPFSPLTTSLSLYTLHTQAPEGTAYKREGWEILTFGGFGISFLALGLGLYLKDNDDPTLWAMEEARERAEVWAAIEAQQKAKSS
eukprot:TRINITY_DN913_c0_g1_i2.p1 TRINITY_DN913_c0_g1~~TRINITY_DN913_c0_g1_i2.p1  ORF type:complete len:117 (+),score=7.40 TRINITY_DN913_c0_g1_i2:257-607(+)